MVSFRVDFFLNLLQVQVQGLCALRGLQLDEESGDDWLLVAACRELVFFEFYLFTV